MMPMSHCKQNYMEKSVHCGDTVIHYSFHKRFFPPGVGKGLQKSRAATRREGKRKVGSACIM